jgi:ribokinase
VLVGAVSLDVLHRGLIGIDLPAVVTRWGGVVKNVACALGTLGARPVFVSADYEGELQPALARHLADYDVEWLPLPTQAPLSLFHARVLPDGDVSEEHFIGLDALRLLTPAALDRCRAVFRRANAIVSCTDVAENTLAWLANVADEHGVPFWLLSSDSLEVAKLRPGGNHADLVALNLAELAAWANAPLSRPADAVASARRLVEPMGRCLLTMGAKGALLVASDEADVERQAPPMLNDTVAVGAGDVLFACLLRARLAGVGWREALREATGRTAAFLGGGGHPRHPYLRLHNVMRVPPSERWSEGGQTEWFPATSDHERRG